MIIIVLINSIVVTITIISMFIIIINDAIICISRNALDLPLSERRVGVRCITSSYVIL